jgi:hypothetical protein
MYVYIFTFYTQTYIFIYAHMHYIQVTDEGVSMLALMCDLRELSLRENHGVSDDSLASLAQGATDLEVLDLLRCRVSMCLYMCARIYVYVTMYVYVYVCMCIYYVCMYRCVRTRV